MSEQVYQWTDEIWSIHVEVENPSNEAVDVTVEFLDTARPSRSLRVASQETMRFNIARVDRENSAIRLTWPDDVSLRIFENLDRAFYGIDAVATP